MTDKSDNTIRKPMGLLDRQSSNPIPDPSTAETYPQLLNLQYGK